MSENEIKDLKKFRVKSELKIMILKTINQFDSLEEPDYGKLENLDVINVLSDIIKRKSE